MSEAKKNRVVERVAQHIAKPAKLSPGARFQEAFDLLMSAPERMAKVLADGEARIAKAQAEAGAPKRRKGGRRRKYEDAPAVFEAVEAERARLRDAGAAQAGPRTALKKLVRQRVAQLKGPAAVGREAARIAAAVDELVKKYDAGRDRAKAKKKPGEIEKLDSPEFGFVKRPLCGAGLGARTSSRTMNLTTESAW